MSAGPMSPSLPDATGRGGGTYPRDAETVAALPPAAVTAPCPVRDSRWIYGLRRVDCNGRVIDKKVIDALGWISRARLEGSAVEGSVRLALDAEGRNRVTRHGDRWLSARLRRRLRLNAGDQVLSVADTTDATLCVFTIGALDRLMGAPLDNSDNEVAPS
ncbi:hypothetical protein [Nocardia aurea]|uniref:hypothetical protein n=1 Tax=Nocardia aurea TaxID=2144174 RepID=UPI0033B45F1B